MTTDVINGVPRELLERAVKGDKPWPRLDKNWACVGCGNWMPKDHPEAHEHEEGCEEEALTNQRHWRSQLRALLATAQPAADGELEIAYDKVDRYLRNNLDDDDYAEFSASLDKIAALPAKAEGGAVPDEHALFEFLSRKYVQRAAERQRALGLVYMEAETHDLAAEIAKFIAAAPVPPLRGGQDE